MYIFCWPDRPGDPAGELYGSLYFTSHLDNVSYSDSLTSSGPRNLDLECALDSTLFTPVECRLNEKFQARMGCLPT